MDPVMILVLLLAGEILSGGRGTAATVGGLVGSAKGVAEEVRKAYRARVERLSQTSAGKVRVAIEARVIGGVAGFGRGVRRGFMPGVRDGLATRRRVVTAGKVKVSRAAQERLAARVAPAKPAGVTPAPLTSAPPTPPRPRAQQGVTSPTPGGRHPTQGQSRRGVAAAPTRPPVTSGTDTTDTQGTDTAPTGAGDTEEQGGSDMSQSTVAAGESGVGEVTGAQSYLAAWDATAEPMERRAAELAEASNDLLSAVERGSKWDLGSGLEIAGQLQQATEEYEAARERVTAYAMALHDEHDAAVEALRGSQTEAGQEYVGQA